jgi:hypothetical protein
MGLAEIKDQLVDNIRSRWGDFQETEIYNNLKERYENLPSVGQKAVVWGSLGLLILCILMIPYSWISSSSTNLGYFLEDKAMLSDLMRVSRDLQNAPKVPTVISPGQLKSQIQEITTQMKLIPEQQIDGILEKVFPRDKKGGLIGPVFEQKGVELNLKKLNLKQIVDVSHKLQEIGRGSKVMAMDMVANKEDNHYYDATFHVIAFSLPSKPSPRGKPKPKRRGK